MEVGKIVSFNKYEINNKKQLVYDNKVITKPYEFVKHLIAIGIPLFGMFSPRYCHTFVYNGLDNEVLRFINKIDKPIINSFHKKGFLEKFFSKSYLKEMLNIHNEYKELEEYVFNDSINIFSPVLIVVKKLDGDFFNILESILEDGHLVICDLRESRFDNSIQKDIKYFEDNYELIFFERIRFSGSLQE